jgi:DNA gyrase subunit A
LENTTKRNGLIQSPLEEVLPNSMMPYAEFVIMDRALPRVEDGLKPVQRRILYTMFELGLTPDKPHKKCARIVGDCMGKYHPHGDSSVYDAMVRMAQDFNMRMTLVNGHGNFGSVDGDRAAAMRYTEARMQPLALELLKDLDKDTVKFNLNFDDSLKEPDTLPGRYPNLLVNGASGIAVGLATNIPPHNLAEVIDGVVAYIENKHINLKTMMKYIKGPDFPTGGYIIAEELEQAYETGRGKIIMRAKINVEQSDNDKKNIVITELPYQVNKATLLKKIADLREDKKDLLSGIADIVDESDRNGMRAVIKIKKDIDVDKIIAVLLKNSDLECTFGINMVAIADGKPLQMGLIQIISYYVEYQRTIIYKRTKYELNQAKERCHILEGLIIAVRNIDEVIAIIKKAENVTDARNKLKSRFNISDKQAQAILDLRLARLTKLEIFKLEEELKELHQLIIKLQAICDSKKLQMDIVKDELSQIKKQYKDARRTQIVDKRDSIAIEKFDDEKIASPYYFIISEEGNLKKVTEKNYNMTQKTITEKSVKNDLINLKLYTQSDKEFLMFSNTGFCYKIEVEKIPECKLKDKGISLNKLCLETIKNEKIIAVFELDEKPPKGSLIFLTKDGYIKKSDWSEYYVAKAVFQAVKLKDGDEILNIENDMADSTIFFVTSQGQCLNAYKNDVPTQGRISGGVKGIQLNEGDKVIYAAQIDNEGEIILFNEKGVAKRVISSQIDPMARYRKGVKITEVAKNSKIIFVDYVKEPYDLVCESSDSSLLNISTEDVIIDSRTGKGKQVSSIKKIDIQGIYKNNLL